MWEEPDAGPDGMVRTLFFAVLCSYICWPVCFGHGVEFFFRHDLFDRGGCVSVCCVSTSLLYAYPHNLTVWLWIWLVDLWKCSRWPTSRINMNSSWANQAINLFIILGGLPSLFLEVLTLKEAGFLNRQGTWRLNFFSMLSYLELVNSNPNGWWVGRWSSRKSGWTALLCSKPSSKTSGSSGNTPV